MGDIKGEVGALPSARSGAPTGLSPEDGSQAEPPAANAGLPSQADHDIAERANIAWGQAINGPHVAVIAAQMARREGFLEGLAAAARIAKAHRPDRILKGQTIARYDPEDREIIRAEENGEAIAASIIAANIKRAGEGC